MIYVASPRRRPRRGAILVHMVLCLTALFGVMAVALDGGMLLAERRHGQATADAAALAGAADLFKNYMTTAGVDSGTAATSANTTATANGYTAANSTVTVRVYPANYLGGPHAGTQVPQGYIEVTVTYNQARFFSSMWGSSSIPISARAVARGQWVPSAPALLALAPSGSGTILTTGNGSINVSGGDIVDDSSSSSGIVVNGKNALVTDPGGILVAGAAPGYSGSGTVSGPVSTGQPPMPDPLRFIPEPSVPAAAPPSTTDATTGITTYYPGYYASDPRFTGSYGTVVLQPGIYYMGGGLTVNGNSSTSLTGNGVMIFIGPSGSLNMAGNSSVTLSPSTSPTDIYQGIAIFQSRSNTTMLQITGTGSETITGTIYAPDATVSVTGNNATVGSQIIASQVQNKGAGQAGAINVTYNSGSVAKTRVFNLVE